MVLQHRNLNGDYGVCCFWTNITRNDMKDKDLEEIKKQYREAAAMDAWLFGDYDAYESYGINKKKTSDTDDNS